MMIPIFQKLVANFTLPSPSQQIINQFRKKETIIDNQPLNVTFELAKNKLHLKSSLTQTAQDRAFKSLGIFESKCTDDQKEQLEQLKNDTTELAFSFDNGSGVMKLAEFCEMNKYNFLSIDKNYKQPIALDFFFNSDKLYGFPMHSTNLLIKDSCDSPYPYCLDNYDRGGYVGKDTLGLYGSMPILIIPCLGSFIGIVWKNASKTQMDVRRSEEGMEVLLVSEQGDLDVEIMVYKTMDCLFLKLGELCGFSAMPRYFGLGYQHCRWSFKDENDVREVNEGFNKNEIPYDVIYLDIDHTDNMKYFTFDKEKYPDVQGMIKMLEEDGRKLVTIVDPHIKVDKEYQVYQQAKKLELFVKDKKLKNFKGWCWPGDSCWIDFLNEDAREFWAKQFQKENYKFTNDNVYIWNDMNEPAVFNQIKNSFPLGCKQKLVTLNKTTKQKEIEFIPHELIHNLYGISMVQGTYQGLLERSGGMLRPFILSRSFFCGSQKYSAFWTGDTESQWEDLAVQVPILLTLGLCGYHFTGSDIGGFFNDPSDELLIRWYQFGALTAFFRGHSHHKAKRREPWLYSQQTMQSIKHSIKLRYELLPYLYTQMFVSHITNFPFLRFGLTQKYKGCIQAVMGNVPRGREKLLY